MSESGRRYPQASYGGVVSPLDRVLRQHEYDMSHAPRRACSRLFLLATGFGISISLARAGIAGFLAPATERVLHFGAVFRTCLPLYVLPFTLVSQFDCWTAVAERARPKKRQFFHDAASDLG